MRTIVILWLILLLPLTIFAYSADAYLVELGKAFLEKGYIQEAKAEFEKALIVNPSNTEAGQLLGGIRNKKITSALDAFSPERKPKRTSEKASDQSELYPKEGQEKSSRFKLSGETQLSFGVEDGRVTGKKANADLNEANWRVLSETALNRKENTFDPAVFSRLRFQIDAPAQEGLGFHSDFDISPWSFIGTSDTVTASNDGDIFDVEYKYWSNSRYTLNETVFSNLKGDAVNLPEIKVVDGKVVQTTLTTTNTNVITIPETDIDWNFWPLRELWFDYNTDNLSLRIFPVATERAAYSSNDPLGLTNHHTYWEESQWLVEWDPGHLNSGLDTPDFFKGRWNDAIAFAVRDSTYERLTALRGFSLNFNTGSSTLDFSAAAPKTLWQDYDELDTWQSSLRGRHFWLDNLTLGFVYGSKFGYYNESLDAVNNFLGVDANVGLGENTEVFLEAATSVSEYEQASDNYGTKKKGNTFQVSLVNSSDDVFGKDYFGVNPENKENSFYKLKLSLTHMDKGFESALSSYRGTRDDSFWSRHLNFREPFSQYFPEGLSQSALSWDDVKIFAIGDGIDYGRDVINFRYETANLLSGKLDTLFDVRNVHSTDGKFIENVVRLETNYQATDKLLTKILGIYHSLPKTKGGVDPFVTDPLTDDYYLNTAVEDGKDPTLKTISVGAKYDFVDWLDLSFVWEHTNDSTLACDNFPRGILSGSSFATFEENGQTYREQSFWLNYPSYFDLPSYSEFDIFKVGLGIRAKDNLHFYLDYTRNENEWAQTIDDNMNHVGIEASYLPIKKLGLHTRYVYSRAKDISELNDQGRLIKRAHHNIFSEVRLVIEEDSELIAQYGVGSAIGIYGSTYSPFGGSVATLDTQHIFRLYYRKKF